MLTGNIISAIEAYAPPALQEQWDNTGVQVGSRRRECSGVLLCVDVTPDVVREAIDRECNLIISHHPLLFKGLKRITGASLVEEAVILAIKHDITIYSAHTAMDSAQDGVSYEMAKRLGARCLSVLQPLADRALKLTVYVERSRASEIADALLDAGAGDYNSPLATCSAADIAATSLDTADAPQSAPVFGNIPNLISHTPLTRIETHVAAWRRADIEQALAQLNVNTHLTYEFQPLSTVDNNIGLGMRAVYDTPLTPAELIERVKMAFNSPIVRTSYREDKADMAITRIAMCGGAGGEFIPDAIRSGAQAFISSDIRYHDFVTFGDAILIIDIGHFESESCTKDIFYHVITEKFPNFAVYYSQLEKNPINYL
jgi:dinuclear metal center YbgI/SA1388 family protein